MLNNHFKIALRTIRKQKFYAALNTFGLSLGIAVGLLLFQFIRYHLSFDTYHHNPEQVYRVVTEMHLPDSSLLYVQGSPLPITAALKNELPGISDGAVALQIRTATIGVSINGQNNYFTEHENIAFTDVHWFTLFNYSFIEGNAATALTEPNTVVITRRLAQKYFGNEHPIGKILQVDNKNLVTVTGVVNDYAGNSDLKTELFLSRPSFQSFYPGVENQMNSDWGYINSTTQSYVRLANGVPTQKVVNAMTGLGKIHFPADIASVYQFRLQPLKDIHFDGRYGGTIRKSLLITLAIAGLFLVIIACFNFINLASAQSVKRAKEIGTRKVLGGTPASIFRQFITEISCIVLLAALLALVWVTLFLPVFNNWVQTKLQLNFWSDGALLAALALLLVFVILASGIYPAFILSRFKPLEALKKQKSDGRTVVYRKGLIVIQNMIVQGLIICALIVTLQVKHLKTTDPGFNKESVLLVPVPGSAKSNMLSLAHKLEANPAVQSVSFCYQMPSAEGGLGGSVKFDTREWEDFSVRTVLGDAHYLSTFGLRLLAGNNLRESDTVNQTLINETLLHKLGFTDPQQVIGRQLVIGGLDNRKSTIVGIVNDFNVHSLYTPMEPVIITTQLDRYQYAAIKLGTGNQEETRNMIRKAWQEVYPANVFEYRYVDEQIDEFYHKEDLLNKLIKATTTIAIIISCLGLLGLISFFTVQRTKEIGIRKVLGASVPDIVYLLSKDFLVLLLLSIVITSPIALYFMNQWLEGFAYRIHISWWMFALAGLASMLIACITVSFQSVKAAIANPVKALRSE